MAKARKLKSRRKRAPSGKAIRISNAVLNYLSPRIKGLRSYDAYLRRAFGIDDWQGNPQPIVEGYMIPSDAAHGKFILKTESWALCEEAAYTVSIEETASKNVLTGKKYVPPKPIKMREIP